MRSIIVAIILFGVVPFIITRPVIGLYAFAWVSYMNPHRLTWGFAYLFPFAFMIGAVTTAAWVFSKEPKKLPLNAGTVIMLIFTAMITLSTVLAVMPELAQEKWNEVIKILFITFLTIILINSRRRFDTLIWVIVLSIGYFSLRGGFFAIITGGAYRVWGPPASMIEENNALGLATIMILPLMRYLQLQATNKFVRWGLLSAMLLSIISALASYSRGAFIAISAMGMFLLIKSRHRLGLGLVAAAVVVAGISFMPQKYFDRLETIQTYEKDESAMARINSWTYAFRFALDHPFIGGGFKVFDATHLWQKYAPNPVRVQEAHSIYFEMLAYNGFVGLIIFLLLLAVVYRYGSWVIRHVKTRSELTWARDAAAMTQVSLIGFCAGGAFLSLAFFDLFWHLIAILIILRELAVKETTASLAGESLRANASSASTRSVLEAPPLSGSGPHPSFLRKRR